MTYIVTVLSPISVFCQNYWKKVVANRLYGYIFMNKRSIQCAYKRVHLTEAALIKKHNDIFDNIDNSTVIAPTLLDLSAAFAAIDYSILFSMRFRHFWFLFL